MQWFGLRDRIGYYCDLVRDVPVALLEEFGFDQEWRTWALEYIKDRETWKAAAFGVFMLAPPVDVRDRRGVLRRVGLEQALRERAGQRGRFRS